MGYYAQQEFAARREHIARLTAKRAMQLFNSQGDWVSESERMKALPFSQSMPNDSGREKLWFAHALLHVGSPETVERANRIIQTTLPNYPFCHFFPFVCLQTFCHYEDKLEPETVRGMDTYIHTYIDDFMKPGLDFIGNNDNFPCMSSGAVLFAGQRYGVPAYIEKARERLGQLVQLFERRGFSSEYTSPTYTPIQALVLADIANFSEDDEIREMAIYCEQRVLADLLLHMFWPAAQCAGAHARGYPVDAAGCTHHARFLYYMLYGDELPIGLDETLFCEDEKLENYISHHSWDFLRISAMWQAVPDYHCPVELAEWAKNREYPYICSGTAETTSCKAPSFKFLPKPSVPLEPYYEHPSRQNFLYTYMTEDYALGSSRYGYRDGEQSHGLRMLYRKHLEIRRQEDVGSMFVRYVVNDQDVDWSSGSYFELGSWVGQQRENTAMMLYSPRILHNEGICSLKLTVNFVHYETDDMEIWAGAEKVDIGSGYTGPIAPVFFRDGPVYVMLQPLLPEGSGVGIEIRKKQEVIEIAFVNYRGEAKDFARAELLKIGNGLALEVRSEQQAGSFEAFRKGMTPKVQDSWFNSLRRCRYENGGHAMALEYSPISQSLRYLTQDDMPVEEPRIFSSGQQILSHFNR